MAEIDYTKGANESIDQYNTRIATARAANGSAAPQTADTSFVTQLQEKLLGQSDLISSENTNLENKINEAISSVREGAKASTGAVESAYNREKGYAQERGATQFTRALEEQRGFATNTAALRQIQEDTNKELKDLEQRKQELILQGQAAAAGQISQLQLQAVQFRQQAQQQVFSNLLGMSNFGLQIQQQRQQEIQFNRQQSFQESSAISNVALTYGLDVRPGDTLQSITTRAMPFASKKQQLELAQMQANINKINAEIAQARQGSFDGISTSAIAAAARSNPALLGALASKNPQQALQVQGEIDKMEQVDVQQTIAEADKNGYGMNKTIEAIQNDPLIMNKGEAIKQVTQHFAGKPASQKGFTTAGSVGRTVQDASANFYGSLFEFFTGQPIRNVNTGEDIGYGYIK